MFTHSSVQTLTEPLVLGTVELYNSIRSELLPTPSKSHYTFNLRDLSKVVQGVMRGDPRSITAGPGEEWCGQEGWGVSSGERRMHVPPHLQHERLMKRRVSFQPFWGRWCVGQGYAECERYQSSTMRSSLAAALACLNTLQACWPCGCTSARVCLRTA